MRGAGRVFAGHAMRPGPLALYLGHLPGRFP